MNDWKVSGEDPDYRFTLANERTFLAWVRTGLGFFVAAIAVDQLGAYLQLSVSNTILSLLLSMISAFCIVCGYVRWRRNEIAIRNNQSLEYGMVGFTLMLIALFIIVISMFVI